LKKKLFQHLDISQKSGSIFLKMWCNSLAIILVIFLDDTKSSEIKIFLIIIILGKSKILLFERKKKIIMLFEFQLTLFCSYLQTRLKCTGKTNMSILRILSTLKVSLWKHPFKSMIQPFKNSFKKFFFQNVLHSFELLLFNKN